MAHYARVIDGVVVNVIVADEEMIQSGKLGNPETWYRTSYNTIANTHPENRPFRGNYAALGYTYDAERDAFIPPKPSESAVFNEQTYQWEAPVPYPNDGGFYIWNEENLEWVLGPNMAETM